MSDYQHVAKAVHLSPYHFYCMFKKWAGVTPKIFLQYISLNQVKKGVGRKTDHRRSNFSYGTLQHQSPA